jgi:Cu/Ag efflux pump CusA
VRSAVVVASVIVILVFLPVFFLPGVAGSFFRPLALAYLLAISASLLVALTVTPVLAFLLLPRDPRREDAPFVRFLKQRYRRILPPLVARPRRALIGLAVAFAATLLALPFLGQEFLPVFKERDFLMHWIEKPGTSLEALRRVTLRVSDELRAIPGVRNFGAHLGRAEAGEEVVGPNFAELWISIDDDHEYDAAMARIRSVVEGYPGIDHDVLTYLRERISEVLTGAAAALVVRVYGPDLATLRAKAEEIRGALAGVPGVADLKVEQQVLVPQVEVRLRPEAEAVFGLTAADVRRAATTFVQGSVVGQVYREQRIYDVAVVGAAHVRSDLEGLRALPVELPAGGYVRLGHVADVRIVPAPNEIRREKSARRIDVLCNVSGRDLGSVAADLEARVHGMSFPRGYHAELVGEHDGPRAVPAASARVVGALAGRHPAAAARGLSLAAPDAAGGPDAPVRADRRRRRRFARRRLRLARVPRGVRDRPRHRGPQRDHARQPLPPPRTPGGDALRRPARAARR